MSDIDEPGAAIALPFAPAVATIRPSRRRRAGDRIQAAASANDVRVGVDRKGGEPALAKVEPQGAGEVPGLGEYRDARRRPTGPTEAVDARPRGRLDSQRGFRSAQRPALQHGGAVPAAHVVLK